MLSRKDHENSMSNDVMFTEEEAAEFLIGPDAFETGKLQREIAQLQRQLDDKDRAHTAQMEKLRNKHETEVRKWEAKIEKAKTWSQLKDDKAREDERKKRLKAQAAQKQAEEKARLAQEKVIKAKAMVADASDDDIVRMRTAMQNAQIMVIVMEDILKGLGGGELERMQKNNLQIAMREWCKNQLDWDIEKLPPEYGDYVRVFDSHLLQMLYAHLCDIFQPHKVVTAAYTKDADPSKHPFLGVVGVTEAEDDGEYGHPADKAVGDTHIA